jgi:uncharacterized protein YndB with AHSA1/START domain
MSNSKSSSSTARFDWLPRIDFIIEHPAEAIWPFVVHWDQWIGNYRCEHVAGPVDAAGELKRVSRLDDGGKVAEYFHIEVVAVTPKERLAYRILPEEDFSLGPIEGIQGYEIFNVHPLGERTLVSYETVAEMTTSQVSQAAFDESLRGDLKTGLRSWVESYIPELKRLLQRTKARGE